MVSIVIYFCHKQKDVWVILSARMKCAKQDKENEQEHSREVCLGAYVGQSFD